MVNMNRGFKLGHKLVKIIKWTMHPRNRKLVKNVYLNPQTRKSKIFNWAKKSLSLFPKCRSGYIRVGQDPDQDEKRQVTVPKGHLAIYVGEKKDDTERVLVPLVYFNHPLFSELLRWAEEEFGFGQSGGIQIPCRVSEFERINKMIANATGGVRRKQHLLSCLGFLSRPRISANLVRD